MSQECETDVFFSVVESQLNNHLRRCLFREFAEGQKLRELLKMTREITIEDSIT